MKTLLLAGTFLLLWADISLSAAAPQVTCGATLGPGKKYKLDADLTCLEGDVLTLRDRARLDLNGHTIVSVVVLTGSKAELRNGTIEGGNLCINSFCLILEGGGSHVVENVNIVQIGTFQGGILVASDNNHLLGNTCLGDLGIDITGANNVLQGNVSAATQVGFSVRGNGNQLIDNSSTQSREDFNVWGNNNVLIHNFSAAGEIGQDGFTVYGQNNRLLRNVAIRTGIIVRGQNNVLEANVAFFAFTDLFDADANCDNNTWRDNVFASANQTCIQ